MAKNMEDYMRAAETPAAERTAEQRSMVQTAYDQGMTQVKNADFKSSKD